MGIDMFEVTFSEIEWLSSGAFSYSVYINGVFVKLVEVSEFNLVGDDDFVCFIVSGEKMMLVPCESNNNSVFKPILELRNNIVQNRSLAIEESFSVSGLFNNGRLRRLVQNPIHPSNNEG